MRLEEWIIREGSHRREIGTSMPGPLLSGHGGGQERPARPQWRNLSGFSSHVTPHATLAPSFLSVLLVFFSFFFCFIRAKLLEQRDASQGR